MKRLGFILTFLLFLVVVIELRLRFVDNTNPATSFVSLMILVVISGLYWGFLISLFLLLAIAAIISYFFLTPQDLTQLSSTDVSQIALFILEGLAILFFMSLLKRGKEVEHELRERFQVILSSIGDAVIATDKDGKIKYMNAAAQRLTGWNFREAQKKKLNEILKMEDSDDTTRYHESIEKVFKEGNIYTVEKPITFHNKKGKTVDIQDTIAPLCNTHGNIIGLVLIFRDVTAHREMEEQREVLLGSISHELKNYITSIQGYTHIVRKKTLDTKDEKLISYTDKLYNKVETMKNMIISMLDLSKLRVGKLDMQQEEFDLEELISTIINDLQINTKHIIKIKGVLDTEVVGDRIRVGQVLTNLLSNAIKYSPEEKEIHVLLKKRDGEALVGVQDFGKGISAEKMEKIFKPFYRAVTDDERSTIAGSGLGLYISKEIVNQHGGSLWVKSEPDKGSIFYFTLPLAAETERYGESSKEPSMKDKIRRLLKFEYAAR